jgi:hypothetical protein
VLRLFDTSRSQLRWLRNSSELKNSKRRPHERLVRRSSKSEPPTHEASAGWHFSPPKLSAKAEGGSDMLERTTI